MGLSRRVSLASDMTRRVGHMVRGVPWRRERLILTFGVPVPAMEGPSGCKLQGTTWQENSVIPNLPIQRQTINLLFSLLLCFVWSLYGYVSHASGSRSLFRVALGKRLLQPVENRCVIAARPRYVDQFPNRSQYMSSAARTNKRTGK